jgi:hypothetical protein
MSKLGRVLFPIASIELTDFDVRNRLRLQTANIHAQAVRVRARHVERLDPTNRAKEMARDASVESVGREEFRSLNQFEAGLGNDEMKVTTLAANRTIALCDFNLGWRRHLELDPAAVTTAGMFDQVAWQRTTPRGGHRFHRLGI